MSRLSLFAFCLFVPLLAAYSETTPGAEQQALVGCVSCHANKQGGFNPAHSFAASTCVACHSGDTSAASEVAAHKDLIAFPGNLDNAERACGSCHADRVESVTHGLMHTARGMVRTTRMIVDGSAGPDETQNLQSLGHTVADSILRKQCASCHLGQGKTSHTLNVTSDRGGGCLACHVNENPENTHPMLTTDISSGRCFGCHSRSGRISLSYAGLAEVQESKTRLADGRAVRQLAADVHYEGGMRCSSCHKADEVMAAAGEAVAATCLDCHEKHADDTNHARLTCATCHSQWAPQCFGCHMEYDENGEQWDHIEKQNTAGRWHSESWDMRHSLPPLGVNAENQVEIFVPGMIMTVAHPSWPENKFMRVFAPLSPHTTGKSRSCESCHRSSEALGLGMGEIKVENGSLIFEPVNGLREDGLPADAWTNIDNTLGGRTPRPGQRPFTQLEMKKILEADIQQDSSPAGGNGFISSTSSSVNTGGTNSTSGRSDAPAPRSPTK